MYNHEVLMFLKNASKVLWDTIYFTSYSDYIEISTKWIDTLWSKAFLNRVIRTTSEVEA
jgi:hypothetical protein